MSHRLQSAASQAPLSQSGVHFSQTEQNFCTRDETVCSVQEAVVRPQAAAPPARSSRLSAFAFYSARKGE